MAEVKQAVDEMFPRNKPIVPESWLKLHHLVFLFVTGLTLTLIFNGI